jgi:hypothetical protein
MLTRRGATLIELLVTTIVGGIALTLVAAICVRQQRIIADLAHATALTGQLRDASTILPIDLANVGSAAGDIREALDTAIEIRATIASAVVCDTLASGIVLAPASTGATTYAGFVAPIAAGDSAWVLEADSIDVWRPLRIATVASARVGPCDAHGPVLDATTVTSPRVALTLDTASTSNWIGAPLRVTRPTRYSLYRGSDGWSLGAREWNTTTLRFNTIQPLSGPFLSAAAGGVRFTYFDSIGATLASPVIDPRRIALIRLDFRGRTAQVARAVGAAGPMAQRMDSSSTFVFLRNRR